MQSQTCIIWAEELNGDSKAIGLFPLGCLSSFSKVLALGWHNILCNFGKLICWLNWEFNDRMWHDTRVSCQGCYLPTYHSCFFFSSSSLLPTSRKLFSFLVCMNIQKKFKILIGKEMAELLFPILKFCILIKYKINNRSLTSAAQKATLQVSYRG